MVLRWVLMDPTDNSSYTLEINPNTMTSPFPQRAVTSQSTVAPTGRTLLFEGATPPAEWTFGGVVLSAAHYEALRHWVYDKRSRLRLTDHFGRQMVVILRHLDVTPKRAMTLYWRHEFTITALVLSVGAPTVGDHGPA